MVSVGGQPNDGGRAGSSPAEAASAGLAGASGDEGGDSGAPSAHGGSAGAPSESGGNAGALDLEPAACDPEAMWSMATAVPGVSSGAKETLLALTPDELDLVFLQGSALYIAHRASTDADFSPGSALLLPLGWSATHGASLSADGTRLLLVSDPDQKQLGEWTRPNRKAAFSGPIDTSAFAIINQDSDFTGRVYASPVMSVGGDQLFYNSAFRDADSTIVVSSRTGTGVFSAPRTLSGGVFDGAPGKRRLPTGISSDGRTLFYFNEETAEEEARWRAVNSLGSPLYDMLSLGARRGATVNFACDRLYSESNGDVVAEKD